MKSDACDDVKGYGHKLVEKRQYSIIPLEQRYFIFLWLATLMGLGLLIFEVSRSLRHATFGRTPPDGPAAQFSSDNQHSQETDFHARGWI